jgi:hypothetical protein
MTTGCIAYATRQKAQMHQTPLWSAFWAPSSLCRSAAKRSNPGTNFLACYSAVLEPYRLEKSALDVLRHTGCRRYATVL